MNVKELANKLNLEFANEGNLDNEVKGCYIGDLLSWVMSKAQEGDAWITIMSNINIVAVCTLTEAACVILCEGVQPDENCLKQAKEQGLPILLTDKTAFVLSVEISKLL